MKQPHLLLVILDTLRRDHLSHYGYARPTSPELDAYAARHTTFTRAIAPAQWTIPAHASIFTGTYPSTHGLTQANGSLTGSFPTLAETLRGAGYHTVAFCNNPLVGVLDNGLQRGFDRFYNYASVVPQRPDDDRRGWLRRAFNQRFRPYARRVGNRFAQNDTLFRLSLNPLLVPLWAKYINFKGHTANSLTDLMDYWDAQRAGGSAQPMFAFVNLMGAHLPYHPPNDALDRVAKGTRSDRHALRFVSRFNADAAAWASPAAPTLTDWQTQALNDFYDAEIAYQDAQLGRLFRWLETSGVGDETLVVVAADHGEAHGDHGMFGHGFVVYQELVHVPLIVAGERFPAGAQVGTNVSTRRLFHTLLDAAGVTPPLADDDPNADVDGLSLERAAHAAERVERDIAFSEAVPPTTFLHVIEHRDPASIERLRLRLTRRGVYEGDDKLTMVGEQVEGLYDVAADAHDAHDLSHAEPERAAALARQVAAFTQAAQAAGHGAAGESGVVSAAVEEQLRALGYIE